MLAAACTSATSPPARSGAPALPLAGAVSSGSLAAVGVPMGDLSTRVNTFWQLFTSTDRGARWALRTPPGVADNGGIVTAASAPGHLIVGFMTSQLLGFSPLAATTDAGAHWTTGVLPGPLTPVPGPLAAAGGELLALVGKDGAAVDRSYGSLTAWSTLVTRAAIAGTEAGRACGVEGLTAVAIGPGGVPLVGAACSHPGASGLFERSGDTWHAVASPLAGWSSEVAALSSGPTTSVTLVVHKGATEEVYAEQLALSDATIAESMTSALPVRAGAHLLQVGTSLVLIGRGSAAAPADEQVSVVVAAGHHLSWETAHSVPSGTQAVAATTARDGAGVLESFGVARSLLTIDALRSQGAPFTELQRIKVAIAYGSSN